MYVSIAEVRATAQHMTATADPAAPDTLVQDIIERVSRAFDHECGVPDEYFQPAYYPTWQSLHVYVVGDTVTPTTTNSHIYRVTTAGTSGATEPTWPTGSGLTVTNGNVVFTEVGADVVASARTFYGDGTNLLKVDPYVPGTLNTTLGMPTGYTAPTFTERNGFLWLSSSTGVLQIPRSYSIGWDGYPYAGGGYGWPLGVPISVTAKWGYESTPADVKMAVIEWAINIWRETDPAGLKLVGLEGQVLREAVPPRVAEVIKFYRFNSSRVTVV